jgi:hypothetical protein
MLFAQVLDEFAIVMEGLHKIFALKLDLCRLTVRMTDARAQLEDPIIKEGWVGGWERRKFNTEKRVQPSGIAKT